MTTFYSIFYCLLFCYSLYGMEICTHCGCCKDENNIFSVQKPEGARSNVPCPIKMHTCTHCMNCCIDCSSWSKRELLVGAGGCLALGCATTAGVSAGGIGLVAASAAGVSSALQWTSWSLSLLCGIVAGSPCYIKSASCIDLYQSKEN